MLTLLRRGLSRALCSMDIFGGGWPEPQSGLAGWKRWRRDAVSFMRPVRDDLGNLGIGDRQFAVDPHDLHL